MANLQKIKDLAEKQNISIRMLAERVGLKENQIHVMCRNNSTKIDTLEKIAKELGVSVSYFFDEEECTNRPTVLNERTVGERAKYVEGNNNQLNEAGAHDNTLTASADAVLTERVKSLEALVAEKNERITELKERIEELKSK